MIVVPALPDPGGNGLSCFRRQLVEYVTLLTILPTASSTSTKTGDDQ
jgi:hypothetical protein